MSDTSTDSGLESAAYSDMRLLGVGLTEAEAELGLCEDVVCVDAVWARLHDFGVRGYAIRGSDYFAGLRLAAVVFLPSGLFEFGHNLRDATGAALAVIVPMLDEAGRTQNLIAVDLEFKRVARWRSMLPILGVDRLHGPRIEPLRVFPHVFAWLRADRDGIVVFDFPGAAKILCGGGTLAVEDIAFGRELSTKLRIHPPRIVARAGGRRAAA